MSKKLIKIISICAVAVLLPLIILGVALSVSSNKAVTLSIFDGGDAVVEGTSSKVSIFVNDVEQEETTISVKNGTEVTVTWEGVGFKFDGWFSGRESQTQGNLPESENLSYTFTLKNNKVLTAKKSYKTYSLNVKFKEGSTIFDQISYTRSNGGSGTFGAYTREREGYTFKGLMFDENLYIPAGTDFVFNGGSLSTFFTNDTYTLDVTAVWECQYKNLNFKFTTDIDNKYYVYGVKNDTETELDGISYLIAFNDNIDDGYDLTDNALDVLLLGRYEYFMIKVNGEPVRVQLVIEDVKVRLDKLSSAVTGDVHDMDFTGYDTLKDWIDFIESVTNGGEKLTDDDVVYVKFIFERI